MTRKNIVCWSTGSKLIVNIKQKVLLCLGASWEVQNKKRYCFLGVLQKIIGWNFLLFYMKIKILVVFWCIIKAVNLYSPKWYIIMTHRTLWVSTWINVIVSLSFGLCLIGYDYHRRFGFSLWVEKISWWRKWQLTSALFLGKSMARGSWLTKVYGSQSQTWLSNWLCTHAIGESWPRSRTMVWYLGSKKQNK